MTAVGRYARRALVVGAAAIAGLQFTNPVHTNPRTDAAVTFERTEAVPAGVARGLGAACRDCHSNETNWRWYTYVAPLSWWTVGHVNDGRAELNFSVWGTYGRRLRQTRLRAICHLAQKHEMPLPAYALVHPEARLSEHDVEQLCAWTSLAISHDRLGGESH
jgi:hypothetical protein